MSCSWISPNHLWLVITVYWIQDSVARYCVAQLATGRMGFMRCLLPATSCTTCNHCMPRIGQDNTLHELAHNRFPHLSTLLMTHNSGDPVSPPFPVCAFSNLQECQPWTVLSLGGFLSSWGRFHFMSCSCQMCYWVLREYTPDGSQQVYCSLHFTTWSLSCWRTQFHLTTPHSSPLHMLLIMYTHNVVPCKRTTFTFTLSQLSLSIEYWHI